MISHRSLHTSATAQEAQRAAAIAPLTHDEATRLAQGEFQRLVELLLSIEGEEWEQPTYCTAWNVRQMVAHLAGAAAAFASWEQFKRQMIQNPYIREAAVKVDAINRVQVEERAERSPAALIEEFRQAGPRAIRTRARLPGLLRALPVPFGPPLGVAPVGYLTDTIYTRDWWMHRVDLSHATGRAMALSEAHDGRLLALVMRDLAGRIEAGLHPHTVDLRLTGPAGATFRFGKGLTPDATIEIDPLDFSLLASERITPDEARARATIQGNPRVAQWFLAHSTVPY